MKEKTKEEPKKDTVEVSKGLLESLQKKIDMLEQVADKKSLALYYSRNKAELPKIVRLRMMDGKVIVGWRTVKDEVYEDSVTRRWKEIQIIQLLYEDGETEEMSLTDFVRKYTHISAKVLSTSVDSETGQEALKVETDTGKIYEIGVQYVN